MNSIVRTLTLAPEFAVSGFRQAMRELPGGVCVVTAGYGDDISGMTVTSLSSLSAEPPRLMVGINRSASVFPLLQRSGAFGVNILASHQEEIATRFSTKSITGAARFEGLAHRPSVSGAPLLADAAAAIDCQVEEIIERHTHAIVIGRVLEAEVHGERGGLAYRQGQFIRLSMATPGDDLALWAVW